MYSAIIVEDEMLVRVGLKSLIKWDKLGLALVSDASNGQEAFDMYNQYKPDIVITDIKMPQMDGIELIKKIRENDKRTRIVILTCLEEFEIIRKAVELDVDGYIVKLTMTQKEMEDVLRKSISKLNELSVPDKTVLVSNKCNIDVQIAELCKQYFSESKCTTEEFEKGLLELGVKSRGKKTMLALMQIDHYGVFYSKYEKKDVKRIEASILNIIEEVAKKNHSCYVVKENASKYMFVFIIEGIASESKINDIMVNTISNIKNTLKRYFDMSVSFGISSIRVDNHALNTVYAEAMTALEYKFFDGMGTISYSNEQGKGYIIREKIDTLLVPPALLEMLGCVKEYKNRVESFIEKGNFQVDKVRDFFVHIIQLTALSSQIDRKIFEDIVINYTGIIHECETFDEMYAAYMDFIKCAVNRSKEHISYSKGILDAINYIKLHHNEEISLNQIADLINISPNYFSTLFKKELDMNFSEYIINYRIEKAKELLLGTRLLSYEISQRVGFRDGAYFSRTFKKATGLSPNEYRKRWFER
jgi:two-component system, response regulator YesN